MKTDWKMNYMEAWVEAMPGHKGLPYYPGYNVQPYAKGSELHKNLTVKVEWFKQGYPEKAIRQWFK